MTGLAIPGLGYARVMHSMWIVDCASPHCASALTLGPDAVDSHGNIQAGLTWGQPYMRCWDCGYVTTPIIWPADPIAIATILMQRPNPVNRNWAFGETIVNLMTENAAHGLVDTETRGALVHTVEEIVVGGSLLKHLPDADMRRALIAGGS